MLVLHTVLLEQPQLHDLSRCIIFQYIQGL